jgi:thioredoxin-related protein
VFSRSDIARFVNANFTPVQLDIYMDTPVRVRDSLLTESQFRKLLSIEGIPAYYFFDTGGRVIGVLDSEIELLTFKRMLVFIRDGHFFRTPWERFMDFPEASEEAIEEAF